MRPLPRRPRGLVALHALVALPLLAAAAQPILTSMPADGALPPGKVVYVDDGTCKRGQVKEVVGGNREKGLPRQVRCVPKPSE